MGSDMHGADREQPIDATDPIGLEVICRTEHLIPAAFEVRSSLLRLTSTPNLTV
jgi:hypothetical protein